MKKLSLLLISTYNVGLGVWKRAGLYDREIGYYKKLGKYLGKFGIMTYDKANEKPENETYQYYYNRWKIPSFFYSFFWPFLHFKVIREYDVIKTNQFAGAWVALLIKMLSRKKIFILRGGYAWHCRRKLLGIFSFLAYLCNYFCIRFADLVFFVSLQDRNEYLKKYGEKRLGKCRILPNSVDTNLFKPGNKRKDGKSHIALVGRLVEMKNFQSSLLAVSGLSEGLKSRVFVDIVGEGSYYAPLKDIAEKGVLNHKFWGALSNDRVAEVLGSSEIYILPQLFGSGMSKAILEAMAAGNIVIASDIKAHKTTIDDKIDGFLCGTDVKSIQERLTYVISHLNDDEIRTIRERAVKKVEKFFSMKETAKKEYQYICQVHNVS